MASDDFSVNVEVDMLWVGRSRKTRPCTKCGEMAERPVYADVQYIIDGKPGQRDRWYFCTKCRDEV